MTTVELTDEQLEEVRRAILRSTIRDLEHVGDALRELEVIAWPAGSRSSDAQNAVSLLRESLGILDAIGWPRDESREDWEARMNEAAGEASTC